MNIVLKVGMYSWEAGVDLVVIKISIHICNLWQCLRYEEQYEMYDQKSVYSHWKLKAWCYIIINQVCLFPIICKFLLPYFPCLSSVLDHRPFKQWTPSPSSSHFSLYSHFQKYYKQQSHWDSLPEPSSLRYRAWDTSSSWAEYPESHQQVQCIFHDLSRSKSRPLCDRNVGKVCLLKHLEED